MTNKTHDALIAAVLRAIEEHGTPNRFGLAELELRHRGPAAGAAGGVAARWPIEGVVTNGHRLTYEKGKNGPSYVRVEQAAAPESATPLINQKSSDK